MTDQRNEGYHNALTLNVVLSFIGCIAARIELGIESVKFLNGGIDIQACAGSDQSSIDRICRPSSS